MQPNKQDSIKEGEIKHAAGITLKCLLLTRFGDDEKATREVFKDEVDVYISSLMAAFKNPARADHLKPYLLEHDLDTFRRLEDASDARVRYHIMRTEDDLLVTAVGFFQNADAAGPPGGAVYTNGKQGQMGRAESHFRFAFTYTHMGDQAEEEIADVLKQLAVGFEKYLTIISYLMGERYSPKNRFKDAEVYILDRSEEESLRRLKIKIKQDEFLDAYLKWKQTSEMRPGSEELKHRVELLAAELRQLDPSFSFSLG